MIFVYRIFINLILILSPLIILFRLLKNKEDFFRFKEKLGFFSKNRSKGKLIWFHGASVGEFQSIVPLLEKLEQSKKISQILDSVLMGELVESFVSPEQLDEGLKEKLAVGILALGLQFGKTNAEEVFVYQDTQGQYVTAYSKEDVPSTSEMVYYVDFIDSYDEEGNKTTSPGEKKWLRFVKRNNYSI